MYLHSERRTVLLIDSNAFSQKLRATALRSREVEVHAVDGMEEAQRRWTAHAYDLILLAAAECSDEAAVLRKKVREVRPRQRLALLVGPRYLYARWTGPRRPAKASARLDPGPREEGPVYSPQWQATIKQLASGAKAYAFAAGKLSRS